MKYFFFVFNEFLNFHQYIFSECSKIFEKKAVFEKIQGYNSENFRLITCQILECNIESCNKDISKNLNVSFIFLNFE